MCLCTLWKMLDEVIMDDFDILFLYTWHLVEIVICTSSVPKRMSKICQNLDVSRRDLVYRFIQI
jgi:hypothetical protein